MPYGDVAAIDRRRFYYNKKISMRSDIISLISEYSKAKLTNGIDIEIAKRSIYREYYQQEPSPDNTRTSFLAPVCLTTDDEPQNEYQLNNLIREFDIYKMVNYGFNLIEFLSLPPSIYQTLKKHAEREFSKDAQKQQEELDKLTRLGKL